MSFNQTFDILNVTEDSFYIRDTTTVGTDPSGFGVGPNPRSLSVVGDLRVFIRTHGTNEFIECNFAPGEVVSNLGTIAGMKLLGAVPDGIIDFSVSYGVTGGFGLTTWFQVITPKLITFRADQCIFAAIETVSLYDKCDNTMVQKAMLKIMLKEAARYNFDQGNYAKANEATLMVCGKQVISSTSNCNCD